MSAPDSLVVFARFPRPGLVKTRLVASLGAQGATRLYEAFVRDLVDRVSGMSCRVRFAVAPPDGGFAARFGLEPGACFEQVGRDLGERMRSAFARELDAAKGRCVLIGSDAPHLPRARIEAAFAALDDADLVVGPARDGGYYLIGMKEAHDVFSGMTWSVASVLVETERRAQDLNLSVEYLEEDFDVDEPRDLVTLRAHLERTPKLCPATRGVLLELAEP